MSLFLTKWVPFMNGLAFFYIRNICRCTGYAEIEKAIKSVIKREAIE
ncbi:hypothetical protein [Pradoshia sp. D12]|nr:hypothetical protein [Pradoshia sp. D12]